MPNTIFRGRDSRNRALDYKELAGKLGGKPSPKPAEAKPAFDPQLPGDGIHLPWTYDLDYGWTPKLEKAAPRPPLNLPPFYREQFFFHTAGLREVKENAIHFDLMSFPVRSKVYLWIPGKWLGQARFDAVRNASAAVPIGVHATVPANPHLYNALFAQMEPSVVSGERVLVELASHERAVIAQLELEPEQDEVEVRYAVARQGVYPKSVSKIIITQLMDGFAVASFEHLYQAYHPYDIPIIGDERFKLAYRRSSREVSHIPPLALAFFDSWRQAAARGFNPAPRSFGKHYGPMDISGEMRKKILEFVNSPKTTAKALRDIVKDNVYVDETGHLEKLPKKKVGLPLNVAERILEARNKQPDKKFTSLGQIDAVKGVGSDTMSDLITSFILLAGDDDIWYPDKDLLHLFEPKPMAIPVKNKGSRK